MNSGALDTTQTTLKMYVFNDLLYSHECHKNQTHALYAQIKISLPGLIFAQSNLINIKIFIIRLHELPFVLRRSRR